MVNNNIFVIRFRSNITEKFHHQMITKCSVLYQGSRHLFALSSRINFSLYEVEIHFAERRD